MEGIRLRVLCPERLRKLFAFVIFLDTSNLVVPFAGPLQSKPTSMIFQVRIASRYETGAYGPVFLLSRRFRVDTTGRSRRGEAMRCPSDYHDFLQNY